ncbi:hypothetical protein TI39_contig4296g00013 [Zymoseptoria brevis]|uniref:Uncharacterized protein n=1 Tax=Zymoseptoria brevis TaxID=1047168 RepID=A0A0F4G892_9PEZI|nr:hypothetical protein TI39_contig4296g00013 [Zymoseptoria brevis]
MASRTNWKSYDRCTKAELAEIALNRGITVTSLSVPPEKYLRKSDYLAALEPEHDGPAFPFMDLSPELRTRVYEEVLILNDSFTCFPQILATSKEVNAEASNILYGDNLIDIRILVDGVYVHGKKVGEVHEEVRKSGRRRRNVMVVRTRWPRWLRQVQFLRFSLQHECGDSRGWRLFQGLQRLRFNIGHLDSILHSLCSFLASGHNLRSLQIDITGDNTAGVLPVVPHLFQSIHLLGRLKEVKFQGDIAGFAPKPPGTKNVDDALASAWAKLAALAGPSIALPPVYWPHWGGSLQDKAKACLQTSNRLSGDAKLKHMRKSVLDLALVARQIAVYLNRNVMQQYSGVADDTYKTYSAILTNFIRSCIELEAAEYQAARDELERGPDLAS